MKLRNSLQCLHVQEKEISRILQAFKLNAYEVLGLSPGISPDDIRNIYRRKSLLLHPDRNRDNAEAATEAFDRLKKAEAELLDDKTREQLDSAWVDARNLLIRERKLDRDRDSGILSSEEFRADLLVKWREVLIEDELRRRKKRQIAMAEEGRQVARQEEELAERKRKMNEREAWEATRDSRVDTWRSFRGKPEESSGTKRKKKPKLLG